MRETTALGAAIAAGLAVGLWRNFAELRDINRSGGAVFEPQVSRQESAAKFAQWEKAVEMCRGWVDTEVAEEQEAHVPNSVTMVPVKSHNLPPGKTLLNAEHAVTSEVVSSPTSAFTTAAKGMARVSIKEIEVPTAQATMVSLLGKLEDADEEDLLLELRKVEVLQRLKKLRKPKPNCY
jgi:glycerol kinase